MKKRRHEIRDYDRRDTTGWIDDNHPLSLMDLGFKLLRCVEQALIERVEDAIDLAAYHEHKGEPSIPLKGCRRRRKKRSRT